MSNKNNAHNQPHCDQCGYSLQGLPLGSKCPECGSVGKQRNNTVRDATMSAQAPGRYVQWLRVGFLLCMLSILGGLAGPILARLAPGNRTSFFAVLLAGFVLVSGCWTLGLWMITRKRKGLGTITHDQALDSDLLRNAIRLLALAWPCWIILVVFGVRAYGPTPPLAYSVVVAAVGLAAWIGLIPVSVYFSGLAQWASDERLAGRFRGVAWFLMVFGAITVMSSLLAATSLPIASAATITLGWGAILTFATTMYFFYAILKMSMLLTWVLSHQKISADKYNRLNARIEQEMGNRDKPYKDASSRPCEYCDYDLKGLPIAGVCPECGNEYGGSLLFSVRDPARDIPKHNGTPIHIEESTHGTFKHSRPLGIPLEQAKHFDDDDDSPIPLADEA